MRAEMWAPLFINVSLHRGNGCCVEAMEQFLLPLMAQGEVGESRKIDGNYLSRLIDIV